MAKVYLNSPCTPAHAISAILRCRFLSSLSLNETFMNKHRKQSIEDSTEEISSQGLDTASRSSGLDVSKGIQVVVGLDRGLNQRGSSHKGDSP